jgi:hypothetical protein
VDTKIMEEVVTDEELIAKAEDVLGYFWPRLIALARRGAAVKWRPIEEALKDGTRILAWSPEWTAAATCSWYGESFKQHYELPSFKFQPTHFIPLSALGEPET